MHGVPPRRQYLRSHHCKEIILFWGIMWHREVIVYQCVGTMYQSYLQGSRVREEKKGTNHNIDLSGRVSMG
jgi:hypothetical protein